MGHIKLTASDGHTLDAYRANPSAESKGGIVVIQEIFGVNGHIREVTESYAQAGYTAIAPAIFDRAKANVELAYDEDGITQGRDLAYHHLKMETVLLDVQATFTELSSVGKVGIVGYCYGGSVVWAATCGLSDLSCGVGYYGGLIAKMVDQTPQSPTMLHFGEKDHGIPLSDVETIRAAHPDVVIHVYEGAQHGFNCDHRGSYEATAAKLALDRSLAWFSKYL